MDAKLLTYVAGKVLRDLKSGHSFDPELSDALVSMEVADALRRSVSENDQEWLLPLLVDSAEGTLNVVLAVIRPFQNGARIRDRLMALWRSGSSERIKNGLVYRLLDYPDLPICVHEEIFRWFLDNREYHRAKCIEWYGGTHRVVDGALTRLQDPAFPASKAWVRLLQVFWFAEAGCARKIIQPYATHDEPFVRNVAEQLLDRLNEG